MGNTGASAVIWGFSFMSDYDNGFKKAQRDYDNQLPPDSDDYNVICPDCGGGGASSDGETPICTRCAGDGNISVSAAEYKRLIEQAKAEDEASSDTEI